MIEDVLFPLLSAHDYSNFGLYLFTVKLIHS